jgi:hypothetical protein
MYLVSDMVLDRVDSLASCAFEFKEFLDHALVDLQNRNRSARRIANVGPLTTLGK